MVVPAQLTAEAVNQLREGIDLLLGRWSALQMAIQNEWGGRDTRQKAQQLALDIYHWLIRLAGNKHNSFASKCSYIRNSYNRCFSELFTHGDFLKIS